LQPVWQRTVSPICWPTVYTGSSAVIGSWKIIATKPPRRSRKAREGIARTSWPPMRTLPSILVRLGGNRRINARRVTLFPEPDSPRMHKTSPGRTLKLTPFTA
jgi:hypothetical protein